MSNDYGYGEVWWGPAPHKSSPAYRPWLIISDERHPFSKDECIVLAMTSQTHSEGIEVQDTDWVRGGSDKDSYISPWYVTTVKKRDLDSQQGELRAATVEKAVGKLSRYIEV
ncbi:type II toxin-antitoxin system PemK/MazF family toxin [Halorutilales archaeon Cl-col2-1]